MKDNDRLIDGRWESTDWAAIRNTDNAIVFLIALLLQKSWGR